MHVLRDPLFTYEACLPADVRRPRLTSERLDPHWVAGLARSLCRDEANLRIISELVQSATGREVEGAMLAERFAELVTCGRLLLRELAAADVYPLPDPRREQRALAELAVSEPTEEAPPRTWISLELVHAAGSSTARVELEVITASGRELHGRIDAGGRWRCDDIDGGTCSVRLLDHPVLQRRRISRFGGARGSLRRQRQRGEILLPVGSGLRLDLRAAEHHCIVIVPPVAPYGPSF
jgi:hypothetical protein